MTKDALLNQLERLADKHGSKYKLSQTLKVSPQYLNDVMASRRDPGKLLLEGMGLERVVTYRAIKEVK